MKNFTSKSQKIGEIGENTACKFLMKHGFQILERNYTKKWGEIDIIAEKEGRLYFIEVKSVSQSLEELDGEESNNQSVTRETNPFIRRPEENMHPWKMKRLSRTIETYLIHNRIGNTPWQFDLLFVYIDMEKRRARVKTIENIIL